MESEIFFIRSLYVQNAIMGTALGCVLFFLGHALLKKKRKNIVVFSIWLFLVFWFFNSPFFGFSAVTVGPGGIGLDYGILSFRNATLPLGSPWRIETRMGGIRRNKRLYYLIIDDHASMKVRGPEAHQLLQDIGSAIEDMRKKTTRNHEAGSSFDPGTIIEVAYHGIEGA